MKLVHFILIKYMLREVFENGVLRRMYGPEREDVTVGCSKLRYEEFLNLYHC
jgi:hypothetical protein